MYLHITRSTYSTEDRGYHQQGFYICFLWLEYTPCYLSTVCWCEPLTEVQRHRSSTLLFCVRLHTYIYKTFENLRKKNEKKKKNVVVLKTTRQKTSNYKEKCRYGVDAGECNLLRCFCCFFIVYFSKTIVQTVSSSLVLKVYTNTCLRQRYYRVCMHR